MEIKVDDFVIVIDRFSPLFGKVGMVTKIGRAYDDRTFVEIELKEKEYKDRTFNFLIRELSLLKPCKDVTTNSDIDE